MQGVKGISKYKVGSVFETSLGGPCLVLEYKSSKEVLVRFLNTGYETWIQTSKISTGLVRDMTLPTVCGVGYNNEGVYPATEWTANGRGNTKAYSMWGGMMKRCYDEDHRHTAPTYAGCTVNPVWHYYQNFAEFYYEDPWRQDGWHLEKDILVKGNKEYEPDTCVFAPRVINALVNKMEKTRGECPLGVHYKKAKGRYGANYRDGNGWLIHIGYFSNPTDAFYAFKEKKEALVKSIADEWKEKIDPRLHAALYKYTVEITD